MTSRSLARRHLKATKKMIKDKYSAQLKQVNRFNAYVQTTKIKRWKREKQLLAYVGSLNKVKASTKATYLALLVCGLKLTDRKDWSARSGHQIRVLQKICTTNSKKALKKKARPLSYGQIKKKAVATKLHPLKRRMLEAASLSLQRIGNLHHIQHVKTTAEGWEVLMQQHKTAESIGAAHFTIPMTEASHSMKSVVLTLGGKGQLRTVTSVFLFLKL
jgi:hypothetical protein